MNFRSMAVAGALLACLAMAGCGSGAAETPSAAEKDEARLAFAECMREHGVDMPDPEPGGGPIKIEGTVKAGSGGKLGGPIDEEAMKACEGKLGDAAAQEPSPAERQEMEESLLQFSQCMREHGVDMPDPEFEDGGAKMRIGPGSGIDPESPAFQAAQKVCDGRVGLDGKLGKLPGDGPR